jgi:hypothetical protein
VAAFTMQGSEVVFDFGSNLPTEEGAAAVFRIIESAPAGMTSLAYGNDNEVQKNRAGFHNSDFY